MSHTRGKWSQDLGSIDFQLFLTPDMFVDTSTLSVLTATTGIIERTIAASHAVTLFASLRTFLRTGVLATPNNSQRQFGTALSQPGPSSVSGTSDPLAMIGFPPYTAATNPTIAPSSGAVPKGLKILFVDLIYSVAAVNLSAITVGLTTTQFINSVAPATANIVALGLNNLLVGFQATPHRIRVPVVNPAYIVLDGCEVVLNFNLTTPAGGTAIFYGAVIGSEINYN